MCENNQTKEVPEDLIQQILHLEKEKGRIMVALDGRCASGKTTLAAHLAEKISCQVVHMDDFFLQPEQRTRERLLMPGGNVEYERVISEIMVPFSEGKDIIYTPYDCHMRSFKSPVSIDKNKTILIEGAYACHPKLWDYYDLHVFFDIDTKTQMERILLRNGDKDAVNFFEQWIPFEESYLSAFEIQHKCELYYQNGVTK